MIKLSFILFYSFFNLGQGQEVIDSDIVFFKSSENGKFTILDHIERGPLNRDAFWFKYDRRPGVDPWFVTNSSNRESDFIEYFKARGVEILGAFTTYDDCNCFKTKTASSPDMYLLYFKIRKDELGKLIKHHPEPMIVEMVE